MKKFIENLKHVFLSFAVPLVIGFAILFFFYLNHGHAQQMIAPFQTQQANSTFYAGIGNYTTIQKAVTAACAKSGASVVVPAGSAPPDTITGAAGCSTVGITDQRVVPLVQYAWSGSAYVPVSSGGGVIGTLEVQASNSSGTGAQHTNVFIDSTFQTRNHRSTLPVRDDVGTFTPNYFGCTQRQTYTGLSSSDFVVAGCLESTSTNAIPGYDRGSNSLNSPAFTVYTTQNTVHYDYSAGLKGGHGLDIQGYGTSDLHVIDSHGVYYSGVPGSGDEGFTIYRDYLQEVGDTFQATITAKTSNTQFVAGTNIHDNNHQGVNRYLHNLTTGNLVTNVYVTSIAGGTPNFGAIIGISSPIPAASTAICQIATDIDTPASVNGSYTAMTFNVQCSGSPVNSIPLSGTPVVGGLVTFSSSYHEQSRISAVTNNGGGSFTVTVPLRVGHYGGTLMFQGTGSMAYSMYANNIQTNPANAVMHFPFECIGAIDTTHLVCGNFRQSNFLLDGFGMANLTSVTPSNASNTGGTVSFQLSESGNNALFTSAGTSIYISGAANTAFNGPCTGLAYNASTQTVTCSQASSTGQTTTGSFQINFGDTPSGNTRGDIYPIVQVIDVRNPSYPFPVDGSLLVEDGMTFNIGDTVMEDHGYTTIATMVHDVAEAYNPMTYDGSYLHHQYIINGAFAYATSTINYLSNSLARWEVNADTTKLVGLGGALKPTFGLVIKGVTQSGLTQTSAPYPSGDGVVFDVGCPISPGGCADPQYTYDIFRLGENPSIGVGIARASFQPGIGRLAMSNFTLSVDSIDRGGSILCSQNGFGCPVLDHGVATLSAGSATVSSTHAQAVGTVFYILNHCSTGGIMGQLAPTSITSGSGFTITSDNAADTSQVCWFITN